MHFKNNKLKHVNLQDSSILTILNYTFLITSQSTDQGPYLLNVQISDRVQFHKSANGRGKFSMIN